MSAKSALVVDDNSANRDFLERLITSAGFTVTSAACGQDALDLTSGISELQLALIDMELPDINGIQLTSALRKRYPSAYLVVATMHDEFSLIESVFNKGGNVFLVKPHGFMELYKRLVSADINALCSQCALIIDQYGPQEYRPAATK